MSHPLLTEDQVAEMLHLSRRRVQDLCRAHQIGFVQVAPRQRAFLQEHVDAYIRAKTIVPPKRIDTPGVNPLRSSWRGGELRKSQEEELTRAQIRKELRSWR